MTLFDTSEGVAERYQRHPDIRVPANVRVKFQQKDGYFAAEQLDASDADFVFLDPPYHPRDWRRLGEVCRTLAEHELTFAAWYPFFWPTRPRELSGSTRCTRWEVTWADCGSKPRQNLKGCGMLVSDTLSELLPDIEGSLSAFAARLDWKFSIRHPVG